LYGRFKVAKCATQQTYKVYRYVCFVAGIVIGKEVIEAVMTLWEDSAPSAGLSQPDSLGKREKEVLKHIAQGHRSASIATQMGIAVATVEAHRRNILRKLQLHSAADLTRYALRHGMITL